MDQPDPTTNNPRNLVLIGMPGCGKSSTGLLLAKSLCLDFLDTDLLIQKREGMSLQRLIDWHGMDHFLRCEQAAILSIDPCSEQTVIATGGSVVLSEHAMQHLRRLGLIIFLDVPLDKLQRRLRNIHTRGIAMKPGQSLADVYRDRQPRYRAYADRTVQGGRGSLEKMVEFLIRRLQQEGFMPCQPEQLSQHRQARPGRPGRETDAKPEQHADTTRRSE